MLPTPYWNVQMETHPQMNRTDTVVFIVEMKHKWIVYSFRHHSHLIRYCIIWNNSHCFADFIIAHDSTANMTQSYIDGNSTLIRQCTLFIHGHYSHTRQLLLKVFKWQQLEMVKVSKISCCLLGRPGKMDINSININPKCYEIWLMFNEEKRPATTRVLDARLGTRELRRLKI